MRFVLRWGVRAGLALVLMVVLLLSPVAYIEVACRPDPQADSYTSLLPPEHHRDEARTLLTYPEWHIVHAYDDYARVIAEDDPHEFGFLRSIGGFWSSLCALSKASGGHGGFPGETKQMVYVIGVSFTAELLAKAAYEETLGRAATWIRGAERAPLDVLSAEQAAGYARFLQQVPWYKWDFRADARAMSEAATGAFRDRERRFALGTEYRVKAAYAGVIEQAVAQVGADALRLRMIVTGLDAAALGALDGVEVIAPRNTGLEIETPRYRELTLLLAQMAGEGADFVEIAGNDDILLTATSQSAQAEAAIFSFSRQGYGDWRHLMLVKVPALGDRLRAMPQEALSLEHIHDY